MIMMGIDLDGTIEDSRSDMVAITQRLRRRLGLEDRPNHSIFPWVNKGMDQLYRACFEDYIQEDDARLDEVRSQYERDYLENVAVETKLYPGISMALEELADLGSLVLVTNKPEKISRRLIEALSVDQFIRDVIGGDSISKTKPDPLVLDEAARRCQFHESLGTAFMIGDTTADIQMGKAFGARTIWCAWGYQDQSPEPLDFIAPTPEALPGLIRGAIS